MNTRSFVKLSAIRRTLAALLCLVLVVPALALAQSDTPNDPVAQGDAPNDPFFDRQWALQQIGAPCAWQHTTGDASVTVAVVDSGVDLNHPDLVGRLRTDGYDFVDDDADPSDENGHGTNVTGIIAATLNNAEGIAGLAPTVQILPVRVMDAEGVGSDDSIAAGIRYADEKGALVINLSLGATLLLAVPEASATINQAIRDAQDSGAIVVVAAGNDFVPLPNAIVGENEDVLVVAASDRSDRKASFSNSGPWVDVTAPGERIYSTMPTYEVYLTSDALPPEERFKQNYDYMSGTSQATPYVSALAALLFAEHLDWTAAQVQDELRNTAVDIYPNHPSYYNRLKLLGSGRIDACEALGGPLPGAAQPSSAGEGSALAPQALLLVGGGVALCVLVLALLGGVLLLRQRRKPRTPATPQPPVVQPVAPPVAPPPAAQVMPHAAPTNWGQLRVVAGPAQAAVQSLTGSALIIGRGDNATFQLAGDAAISRQHARVQVQGSQVVVEDLQSSSGTYVNEQRIAGPTLLRPGDAVRIGQTTLRYER